MISAKELNKKSSTMKKLVLSIAALISFVFMVNAQKLAFIDTEYILDNIPAYTAAQNQLDQLSSQFQKELESIHAEIEQMYKDFQAESVLLSEDMKRKREDVIITKEKDYKQLQKKYFGPNGDLFKKRQGLVKPIQDDVFNAVQEISNEGSYAIIFDKAGGTTLFFTNPKFDLSDQVLQKLGYK
ncbi:MAG: outer membrane [Prolixibacteraceae bacterium]|nr:MAG: outer membrane [Prolixibacteraceae bacterium]